MASFKDFKSHARRASEKARRGVESTPTPDWMKTRYGDDSFGRFIIVAAVVLIVASFLPSLYFLSWVGIVLIGYQVWRMFSTNHMARQRENLRYLRLTAGVRKKLAAMRLKRASGNTGAGGAGAGGTEGAASVGGAGARGSGEPAMYRYFSCPECHQKVRVPKGKGNIRIICPRCRHEFYKKS